MVDLHAHALPRVGQYILTRELEPGRVGERHLALHALDNSSHVIHRLAGGEIGRNRYGQRKFLAAMASLEGLVGSHILASEEHGLDSRGIPWIATAYTGDARGIVTLEHHLREKGGFLPASEAREAAIHLLQAAADAHALGFAHGELSTDQVLVDTRGSLFIEFYGLSLLLHDGQEAMASEAVQRDEVVSIARIAYRMVTGLLPEEPIIPAGRVVSGLDLLWDDWLDTALYSGAGFRSAAHALSAMAERSVSGEGPLGKARGSVRSVLRRFLFAGV